jgi:hypothetical protein
MNFVISAAWRSNIILFFGGIDNTVEKGSHDRTFNAWPSSQLSLIHRLSTLNEPIIFIRMETHVDDTPLLSINNAICELDSIHEYGASPVDSHSGRT